MQFTVIKKTDALKNYLLGLPMKKGMTGGGDDKKVNKLLSARILRARLFQRKVLNAQFSMLLDGM